MSTQSQGATSKSIDVVLERVEQVRCDIAELKDTTKSWIQFQRDYEREHVRVTQTAESAHVRIDIHEARMTTIESRIEELAKAVHPLVYTSKILSFILAIIGTSVIALIWGIIIGQIQIVMP